MAANGAHRRWTGAAIAVAAAVLLVACDDDIRQQVAVTGGNPERGSRLIEVYGCGSCHTIPGIPGADALVGPPLIHWSQRGFIAGQLANTPDNLVRWVTDPEGVEPGTAMPDLGVTEAEARHIAAYLFTLE